MGVQEPRLRDVTEADLATLFEQQIDDDANWMAAFTSGTPRDRDAFEAKWRGLLGDERVMAKAIVVDGEVAGYVARFERRGDPEITYWLGKTFWGRGLATWAVEELVRTLAERPIYARVASDNLGSIRVLEKCRFERCGTDRFFAAARGEELGELIYVLR